MRPNEDSHLDQDGRDQAPVDREAASMMRHIAALVETAAFKSVRLREADQCPAARAQIIELAIQALTSAMSQADVTTLILALRQAATVTESDHVCAFCDVAIEPWSMLIYDNETGDEADAPVACAWDQYGYTLCKTCHMALRRTRWQAARQM